MSSDYTQAAMRAGNAGIGGGRAEDFQNMNRSSIKNSVEGTISAALRQVGEELDRLDGTLGDLAGRINPCLGPENPQESKHPGVCETSMSPLHDSLINLSSRVSGMRRMVENIAQRVTL